MMVLIKYILYAYGISDDFYILIKNQSMHTIVQVKSLQFAVTTLFDRYDGHNAP